MPATHVPRHRGGHSLSSGSLPPCGGGIGWGMSPSSVLAWYLPSHPSPTRGEEAGRAGRWPVGSAGSVHKARWILGAAVFLALLLSVAAFAALSFPSLTGRVVDDAGVLDAATRASLTQKLADFEAKTTHQL